MKRFRNLQYALTGIVALITFLVYLPALNNAFVGVWDDNAYVVENHHIRSFDTAFFRWAFLDFHISNWHPLTWISHALDYALWGLDPLGHHLTSIILHAINTALVVVLVLKLLEAARMRTIQDPSASFLNDRTILITAGVTGLLFGIHPVHVESVAWVAERKDVLCALFFLMSVISYMRFAGSQESGDRRQETADWRQGTGVRSQKSEDGGKARAGWKNLFVNKQYLLAFGFFVLALMSKPMAVTLPVVLLILDWYPLNRIPSIKTLWAAGVEKIPFLVLSLISSIVTVLAQSAGESIGSLELIPLSTRVLVAVKSLTAYLGKMLLPVNLVTLYPYPRDASLFSFEYLMAILLAAGITAGCFVLAKKQQVWLSAWGYYVLTLIPVLGIIQVGNQAMADRYTYLPSLGPFLIAGLCAAWVVEKASTVSKRTILVLIVSATGAVGLFLVLSLITIQQIGVWKDGFILWDHVIETGHGSATAYNNRGLSFDEMGQQDKAMADFAQAIALDPRNYFAYNNRGMVFGRNGRYQEAVGSFLKAIAINPKHAESYCNLGLSYFYQDQRDRAMENYSKAIELKRDFDMAYLNRGNLYFITGNKELALADYQKACSLGNGKACEVLHLATGGLLSR